MGNTVLLVRDSNQQIKEETSLEALSTLRQDPTNVIWLDVHDPSEADLDFLRRELHFHPLAVEDIVRGHQRPKCDAYDDYYFVTLYTADHNATAFHPHDLYLVWGSNYVVTLHRDVLPAIAETQKRWRAADEHGRFGVPFLVYTLFDTVVDEYFPLVDWVSERVDEIDERILNDTSTRTLHALFALRKQLLRIRRVLAPTRDVLNQILRDELPLIPERLHPYFQDVYDHTLRVTDGLDVYRELLASALDLYVSTVSNRLNQTMKRMTALTLVVMVPTLVAGIYGMNFDRFVPAHDWEPGFLVLCGLMGIMIVGGIAIAHRIDWL
jgi:magnesium transporter